MNIETFQIATAVFGATTIGFAHISFGLRKHLKYATAHLDNLKRYVTDQAAREDRLVRQNSELHEIVSKVHDQRHRALERATAAKKVRAEQREANINAARAQTLAALKSAPLRPREQVVAGTLASKATG